MLRNRLLMALPYVVMLLLAAVFYNFAANIEYTARGDNIGPDFWPRVALGLMMLICVLQAARLLFSGHADENANLIGIAEEDEDDAPRSSVLLGIGLLLTLAYGALVTVTGFLLTTFLFIALFCYAGRYRSHRAIWLSAVIGAVFFLLIFQKVVYVSLPRGVPPFDRVGDFLLGLF